MASCTFHCGHLLPSLTVSQLPFQVGLLIGKGFQLPPGLGQLLLFAGNPRLDLPHLLLPIVLQHPERQQLESQTDNQPVRKPADAVIQEVPAPATLLAIRNAWELYP